MSQKASQSKKESISCKLLILGDEKVGKTTLLKRLESGNFVDNLGRTDIDPTGLPDFFEREFEIDDKTIKLQVWDTAGHERFNSITTQYFRSVQGYILAYDITVSSSFDSGLMNWRKLLDQHAGAEPKILLVGTKLDLSSDREVFKDKAQQYKSSEDITLFYETSAKSGENVEKAFEEFLKIIYAPETPSKQQQDNAGQTTPVKLGDTHGGSTSSKCSC